MRSGVAPEVLVRIRLVCLDLPEVTEEIAWTGVRWCVGKKNFAHVLNIADGWPPAYAKAAGTAGPACVLTFPAFIAALFRRTLPACAVLPACVVPEYRRSGN